MIYTEKTFTDWLKSKGVSPYSESPQFAITLVEACDALDLLAGSKIIILGGDVFKKKNNYLKLLYPGWGWCCDPICSEGLIGYTERSREVARNWLLKLMKENDENLRIAFTYIEKATASMLIKLHKGGGH